jgi:hypothetical protein
MQAMKASDKLVRDLLADAVECPVDPTHAVAQVNGQPIPAAKAHHRDLRLDPLSGRHADEESKLELVDMPGRKRPSMPPPLPEHMRGQVSGLEEARAARFAPVERNAPLDFDEEKTSALSPADAKAALRPVSERADENRLAEFLDAPVPSVKVGDVDLSSLLSGNTIDTDEDEDDTSDNDFDDAQATQVASEELLASITGTAIPQAPSTPKRKRSISELEFDLDDD